LSFGASWRCRGGRGKWLWLGVLVFGLSLLVLAGCSKGKGSVKGKMGAYEVGGKEEVEECFARLCGLFGLCVRYEASTGTPPQALADLLNVDETAGDYFRCPFSGKLYIVDFEKMKTPGSLDYSLFSCPEHGDLASFYCDWKSE